MNDASDARAVFRLIYSSHSLLAPQDQDALGEIFTSARRKNKRLGITGGLIVGDGAFVQTLEGDETAVRTLYEQISHDERHDHLTVLEAMTVPGRTFGRWAMAKVAVDGGPDIRLVSNAQRGKIVALGPDSHITDEQESLLTRMRDSIAGALST